MSVAYPVEKSRPRRLKNFISDGAYSWMQAINTINMGTRVIPESSDGIFMAVVAVIPENVTAMVIIIADQ
jgi:hypothetical protein